LNASDLDKAVDIYTLRFGSPPAKLRPGYAGTHLVPVLLGRAVFGL
jgi:hypothetical protein